MDGVTREFAVMASVLIEEFAPRFGCHVALTGGCLYKQGPRKDVDLVFYKIRQAEKIDRTGLLQEMVHELGFKIKSTSGWLVKAEFTDVSFDLMFPELPFGGYESDDE